MKSCHATSGQSRVDEVGANQRQIGRQLDVAVLQRDVDVFALRGRFSGSREEVFGESQVFWRNGLVVRGLVESRLQKVVTTVRLGVAMAERCLNRVGSVVGGSLGVEVDDEGRESYSARENAC